MGPRWGGSLLSFGAKTYVDAYDRIVADDWTLADADRLKGTVGGWPDKKGGVRARHPIEVRWILVKAWGDIRVKRWRRDEAQRQPVTPPEQDVPTTGTPKRRRKGRYNWEPALEEILVYVYVNGLPESGDGHQARLEALVKTTFTPDECPAESVIRNRVSKLLARCRTVLDEGLSRS